MAGRPPRELTDNEQRQLDALLEMAEDDGRSFLRDVLHYLRTSADDPSARRIFRHPELVERTHEAANHIMIDAQQKVAAAEITRQRVAAQAIVDLAAAELRATSNRVKQVRSAAAESTPQRWAERILGHIHRDEVNYLIGLKNQRIGSDEASKMLKQFLASEEGLPPFKNRDRAAQLLGRLLREQRNELAQMLADGMEPRDALNVIEERLASRFGGAEK